MRYVVGTFEDIVLLDIANVLTVTLCQVVCRLVYARSSFGSHSGLLGSVLVPWTQKCVVF